MFINPGGLQLVNFILKYGVVEVMGLLNYRKIYYIKLILKLNN